MGKRRDSIVGITVGRLFELPRKHVLRSAQQTVKRPGFSAVSSARNASSPFGCKRASEEKAGNRRQTRARLGAREIHRSFARQQWDSVPGHPVRDCACFVSRTAGFADGAERSKVFPLKSSFVRRTPGRIVSPTTAAAAPATAATTTTPFRPSFETRNRIPNSLARTHTTHITL